MIRDRRAVIWLATYGPHLFGAVLAASLVAILLASLPARTLTIEAGTTGGLFDALAQKLADDLRAEGLEVTVVNRDDSMRIAGDLGSPDSSADVGFIAADPPGVSEGHLQQVGSVMLAPVYLFAHEGSDIRGIQDLAGRTFSLYPRDSVGWEICQFVLKSYGITVDPETTRYGNGESVLSDVSNGTSEAGCAPDAPSGFRLPSVRGLLDALASPGLRFLDIPEPEGLQVRSDYLRPVTVPAGAFSLTPVRPPADVATSAALVTLVGRSDLPEELVTVIAHALAGEYRGGTSVNAAGAFPSTREVALPAFRDATSVYDRGLPWVYRELPYYPAAFLDNFISDYGLLFTALFAVLSFLGAFGFSRPYTVVTSTRPRRMKLVADDMHRRRLAGEELTPGDLRRIEVMERWVARNSIGLAHVRDRLAVIKGREAPTGTGAPDVPEPDPGL